MIQLQNYLKNELQPLFEAVKKFPITELIGSSGSFDSLADMIAARYYTGTISDTGTEYTFNLEDVSAIHEVILKSTTAERMKMKGLIEMRVDMIVVACCLIRYLLSVHTFNRIRVSTYALKEGVLATLINEVLAAKSVTV